MCVTLGPWERGQPDTNFWLGKLRINDDPATEIEYEYDDDGLPTKIGDLEVYYESATGRLVGAELLQTGDRITRNDFGEVEQYEAGFQELPGSGSPPLVGTRLLDITYQRDRLGRIERKVETSRATLASSPVTHVYEYEYDPERGWLEEVTLDGIPVETYAYDANGNRTSWSTSFGSGTATYDDQDRLLTYGPYTYTHTENGELLTKSNGSATTTYGYDVFGNLRTVTLPDGIEIEYLIDGRNRRIGKKVNGTIVQRFLYLGGLSPIAELDAAGNVTTQYLYGRGGNVPDGFVRGGVTYRILTDHLGSVRYVLDAQTGDVVQRLAYDAYGRVTLDTNPGVQPFGFAGGLYDYQTGLVRFGVRDYDAAIGRWTAKDPIGFGGGSAGLYQYVGNDPVGSTDSTGLQPERYIGMTCGADSECLARSADAAQKGLVAGTAIGVVMVATAAAPELAMACAMRPGVCQSVAADLLNPNPGDLIPPVAPLAKQIAVRASEIHSVLDPIAAGRRTTAVLRTSGGDIVAGGKRDLSPLQRSVLEAGETAAKAPGKHAEVTALAHAEAAGLSPEALAATRAICPACAEAIEASGGTVTSPTTAVWP